MDTRIDMLGQLKAQAAALAESIKAIETELKAEGPAKRQGVLFSATVYEVEERRALDAKAAEEKLRELGVSHQWFAAHQKVVAGYTAVKVGVRS
jgi:hypothetical protein